MTTDWFLRRTALLVYCVVSSAGMAQEQEGGARAAVPTTAALTTLGAWAPGMRRHDIELGRVDPDHDDDYLYRLPYSVDESYPVIQTYDSRLSHRGVERFTLDFGMPVGTGVYAAREGIVVLMEDAHRTGCARTECGRFANFVVVLHEDGTTGEYFHLAADSVIVELGAAVVRGQLLARSGNTGFSTAPHLHFGVYRAGRDGRTESLAVRFATRGGPVSAPRSGARYLNPLER